MIQALKTNCVCGAAEKLCRRFDMTLTTDARHEMRKERPHHMCTARSQQTDLSTPALVGESIYWESHPRLTQTLYIQHPSPIRSFAIFVPLALAYSLSSALCCRIHTSGHFISGVEHDLQP